MKIFSKIIFIVGIVCVTIIHAQVSGRVLDQNSNPIEDVAVTALISNAQTTTGYDGRFQINIQSTNQAIWKNSSNFLEQSKGYSHVFTNSSAPSFFVKNRDATNTFTINGKLHHKNEFKSHNSPFLFKALSIPDTLVIKKNGYVTQKIAIIDDNKSLGDIPMAPAKTHDVYIKQNSGGSIDPWKGFGLTTKIAANENEPLVLSIQPNGGFLIDAITGCGGQLELKTFTTAPITKACSVSVTFKRMPGNPVCFNNLLTSLHPANGATKVDRSPTFEWPAKFCESTTGDPLTYDVYLCDNSNGECIPAARDYFVKIGESLTTNSFTYTGSLKPNTEYYWDIWATDVNGTVSAFYDYNNRWTFTTTAPGDLLWSYSSIKSYSMANELGMAIDSNNTTYLGTSRGSIIAIDKLGKAKWTNSDFSKDENNVDNKVIQISVSPKGQIVVYQSRDGSVGQRISALDSSNGNLIWTIDEYTKPRGLFTALNFAITPNNTVKIIEGIVVNPTDPLLRRTEIGLRELSMEDGSELNKYAPWAGTAESKFNIIKDGAPLSIDANGNHFIYTQEYYETSNRREFETYENQYLHRQTGFRSIAPNTTINWIHQHKVIDDPDHLQSFYTGYFQKGFLIAIDKNNNSLALSQYGLHKFDATTGDILWRWNEDDISSEGAVIDGEGTIYVVSNNEPTLYAIEPSTGQTKWSLDLPVNSNRYHTKGRSSIILMNQGAILVSYYGSEAVVIQRETKTILWNYSLQLSDSDQLESIGLMNLSPVGILVIGGYKNGIPRLDALDFSLWEGLEKNAPWPIAGQNAGNTFSLSK